MTFKPPSIFAPLRQPLVTGTVSLGDMTGQTVSSAALNHTIKSGPTNSCTSPGLNDSCSKLRFHYGGVEFDVPAVPASGITLAPKSRDFRLRKFSSSPVMQAVGSVFDRDRFEEAREPLGIGIVPNPSSFSRPRGIRILDMPIKFPGRSEFRIPKNLLPFVPAIQMIMDAEFTINVHAIDYYAYLTVDQGVQQEGETQRKPGLHVDGYQGAREVKKKPINRSYIVADKTPTVFYPQSFDISQIDDAKYNVFTDMELQADHTKKLRFHPYEIILIDAYAVHEPDTSPATGHRTFLRVSFTQRIFDRLGNTHNPLFSYDWQMVPRGTQQVAQRYR